MKGHHGRIWSIVLVLALVGCTQSGSRTTSAQHPGLVSSPSPTEAPEAFPIEAFAGISEDPVSDEVAAELQAILDDMAGKAGLSATVMTADGTWSGAAGKADGIRDVRVDDQFAIASTTKSITAAQVMQMVEAGELDLDDLASDHLPPDLDFDTNSATIRDLLGQRSGIPDYLPLVNDRLIAHPLRLWKPAELLELVPADRVPAGEEFEYGNTNYVLLGLVIEHVRGRPIAEALRDGVLSIDGVKRLIYQPDEVPTEPMAMPYGESTDVLEIGGGFLPSLGLTSDGPAAAMASDPPSLARWFRAFCAGEIVSQASLTEMTTMHDGYGLGLYEPDPPGTVGHAGEHEGYTSLAGCLPEEGTVIVILSNEVEVDLSAIAQPLIDAVRSAAGN